MSRPTRQLILMLIGLAAVGLTTGLLAEPIIVAFSHNPALNTGIVAVLLIGVVFTFWQVIRLNSDINWIEDFRKAGFPSSYAQPRLLAPMAAMLKDRTGRLSLNTSSLRSLLDGIQSRLDDSREISRYLASLLIFLGLLGTFWGLLGTVKGVADAIVNLQVTGGQDAAIMFDTLKQSLAKPLSGMGIAFSSSLFGLAGSLIVGFMELQASQAQNRFFNELEDWLSGQTRLSSGGVGAFADGGDQPIPAYIQALLEQTAESLNELQRIMQRSEEARGASAQGFKILADQLVALGDQLGNQQQVTARLAEMQGEMRSVLGRLGDLAASGGFGIDANSRAHLRNLDAHLSRLTEELAQGRNQSVQDIRAEIKLLARTIAAAASSER
ncbi:MAG: flagellar motor protein MotA [Rhodospirillaceae bacterium]|nr:flagellar motor protein MotA [Rhodospirillaceae bacterium]